MADPAVKEPVAGAGKIEETTEFKEALAREREQHRLNLEAEYRRKEQDLEQRFASRAPASTAPNGGDFFQQWGEKHGLPGDAGKELVEGVVSYIQGQVLPAVLTPLSQSSKRQELRSQRSELRGSNPKLAKLDDKYHAEVMKLLEPMQPNLIGPDSYARALHMVIGQNIEAIEAEREAGGKAEEARQPEVAPGPEPVPASGSDKARKVVLNAKQQQFCDEKGFSPEDFVEMMRDRARKLKGQGHNDVAVRNRLGELLGGIEY